MAERLFSDKYKLVKELGEGAMGKIYLVADCKTNKQFALKMILQNNTTKKDIAERFVREIEILRKLNHPNIIKIYDVGEYKEMPFFVMEYINGEPLSEKLEKKQKISMKDRLDIFVKIAQAICYAHENGVVHRDLKPENIMLDKQNNVYVMDFGIAFDSIANIGCGGVVFASRWSKISTTCE